MSSSGRAVLLLLIGDIRPAELHAGLAERAAPGLQVHVVAPTVLGPLDWLATADDAARGQAEVRALDAEWTLAGDAEVGGEAADPDPVQAVEDALRSFPADGIVVAGDRADPELEAALAVFGLPVGRIGEPPAGHRSRARRALRELAAGHRESTPFVLFVAVNGTLFLVAILLSLFVVLVLWLSGNL